MQNWLVFSLLCIFLWGLWGFILKFTYKDLSWLQTYFLSSLASFMLALLVFLYYKGDISLRLRSTYIAMLAGVFGGAGYIFFVKALVTGKASIVIPLTAIYPVVTVVLALLVLGEKISIYQAIGVILAIVATILISIK